MDSITAAAAAMKSAGSSSFFSKLPNLNPYPTRPSSPSTFTFFSKLPTSIKSIQTPNSDLNPPTSPPLKISLKNPNSTTFPCSSAVTSPPSPVTDLSTTKLHRLTAEFQSLSEPIDRVKRLLHYATLLPPLDESFKVTSNRVMGCTTQVWLDARLDNQGKMKFRADSDSEISRGFCSCLVWILDGARPEEVLSMKTDDLAALSVAGLQNSRVNTWHNVLISMQKRTKALVAELEGKPLGEPFPSLVVTAEGIHAKGSYAKAQARFLFPEELKVQELAILLKERKIGVVAHFYMDPEVQGVLTAAQKLWPHIHISDSLVMADMAVKMAKEGCQYITVLGVDFMSENVRAILDQAGFPEVGVYRMSDERIGCSLADAASSPVYMDYLAAASVSSPSLHVVYINTSLETKAHAHELVPTITCTSSNVVQTILQAFAEVPNLNVWYGPDSYMGANIVELFKQMTVMSDEEIAGIHPKHNRNSIKSLLPRLQYYQDGTCVVHHLFGHEVVEKINDMYCDAFLTAHFEVPGEMFSLAMEAKRRGMGVVGSTQNILDFIKQRVQEALDRNVNDHLQFILGTESGMVTAIVALVRKLLGSVKSSREAKVSVEIVFPVSSDSVTRTTSINISIRSLYLDYYSLPSLSRCSHPMASSVNLPSLKVPLLLYKSHFIGPIKLGHKPFLTTPKPGSAIIAKFNLSEILGGRGLCNGEEGLQQELKKPISQESSTFFISSTQEKSAISTLESIPEDGFEKELLGLTGGFPGGEKGLKQFIDKNPPPKKSPAEELVPLGFNQSLTKKPKPPVLPLLMPGMIAIVKNQNSPYYMYCGIVQRITDGKAGVLFEGGNWDRLITFKLNELERREKGPPMVSPRSVVLESMIQQDSK